MSKSYSTLLVADFDLNKTLDCGQVFHWLPHEGGFVGTIGAQPCFIEQRDNTLLFEGTSRDSVVDYFAVDQPLAEIYASFPADPAMVEALSFCRGLRIVRQPAWECVATFITSSMKQVAHIAQISHLLRKRFGRRLDWNGPELFAYPEAAELARLSEADLRACSLGYRAKNLLGAARMIAEGAVDLEGVARLDDEQALAELCRLPGVGKKVANCALLFAFGRLKAFPIDVWIERVLRSLYFQGKRKVTEKRLREFSASYFGPYGGYAQQYLFHHARKTWPRGERKRSR
jgi:N-glycosylase/DNA lyase